MLEAIRALVRPILTFTGLLYLSEMVYHGEEVPAYYITLVLGMLAWWGIDRTRKHMKEDKDE